MHLVLHWYPFDPRHIWQRLYCIELGLLVQHQLLFIQQLFHPAWPFYYFYHLHTKDKRAGHWQSHLRLYRFLVLSQENIGHQLFAFFVDLFIIYPRILRTHVFAESFGVDAKNFFVAVVVKNTGLNDKYSKQWEWYFMISMALSSKP